MASDAQGHYDRRVVPQMFEAESITGADFEPTLIDFIRPPFRKFEFSTPMSTEHAARVLEEIVEPPGSSAGRLPPSADFSKERLLAAASK